MKILIIRNIPNFMDVCHNTYNIQEVGLARSLRRKGHECDILFWTDAEEKDVNIDNVTVFYRHGKSFLKNCIFNNADTLFKNYDILQPCEYNQIQALLLARKYPDKTVIYHGPYFDSFNKKYNMMCKVIDPFFIPIYKKLGTRFLVKSNLSGKFLIDKGILPDQISMVGVGMDAKMLQNRGQELGESKLNRIESSIKRQTLGAKFLYIGRMEPRRDIFFLLDIFREFLQKDSDAKLYMIGTGDNEYCSKVKAKILELNLQESIVWQERLEQKYLSNIYESVDFFLLPTKYEIFGMVLLEAMYYGNIVFTTSNGGSDVLIRNGENGYIIDEHDAKVWAEKLYDVFNDIEGRKRCSNNAVNTIKEEFTWDKRADLFLKVYSKNLKLF